MFKRIMLTLTFVAAFSAVGAGLTNTAQAWRGGWGWGVPYRAYYGPRVAYYPAAVPYRAYYRPRVVVPYNTYYSYPAYVAYPDYYYSTPPAGVTVSFGF
jgi:hypothetical protein